MGTDSNTQAVDSGTQEMSSGTQVVDSGTNATGGGEQSGGEETRVFTQAELDRIIQERLARERQKYGDDDDLKKAKDELDALKAEQMSELEKAQKRAADLEAERDQALVEANDRLIKAAFVAAAAQAGAAHPEDAFALADLSGVEIGEDGQVTGVEDAVKALVEAGRLPMSDKRRAPGLDGGAGGGQGPGERAPELSEEERAIARKMGLTDEQYQKAKKKGE